MGSALSFRLMDMFWIAAAVACLGSMSQLGCDQGLIDTTFTDRTPGPEPWPTWNEGPDNTILMSFGYAGKTYIASSDDAGRSWRVISTTQGGGSYFTRLSETTLLLVVTEGAGPDVRTAWIQSDDNGYTWSEPTPIVSGHYHGASPLRVMSDGRWVHTLYDSPEFAALFTWSNDRGKTWTEPITFPTPADGNTGLSESDILELGPNDYVAAIRADQTQEGTPSTRPPPEGSWDGFYLSWSTDGLHWSAPVSLCERGRMAMFHRLGNLWALSYRLYDPQFGLHHSAIRFSKDGKEWSPPRILEHSVNCGAFIVQVKGRIIALNTRFPARNIITRHDITEMVKELQKH